MWKDAHLGYWKWYKKHKDELANLTLWQRMRAYTKATNKNSKVFTKYQYKTNPEGVKLIYAPMIIGSTGLIFFVAGSLYCSYLGVSSNWFIYRYPMLFCLALSMALAGWIAHIMIWCSIIDSKAWKEHIREME